MYETLQVPDLLRVPGDVATSVWLHESTAHQISIRQMQECWMFLSPMFSLSGLSDVLQSRFQSLLLGTVVDMYANARCHNHSSLAMALLESRDV